MRRVPIGNVQSGKWLATVLLALQLATGCASHACEEDAAFDAVQDGEFGAAFELLRGCEKDPAASADALILLAALYGDDDLNHQSSRNERLAKSWQLLQKAALTGDESAIVTLASVIEGGDEELGLDPDTDVADCLLAITESDALKIGADTYRPEAVRSCLAPHK